MNWLSALKKYEAKITALLRNLIAFFFFLILVLVTLLVIFRRTGQEFSGGYELLTFLFIYTTSIGAAVSVGQKDHISISIFLDMLKNPLKKIVTILNYILIAFINSVMIFYSVRWIRDVGNFESPVLRIPMKYIQIIIPIGCFFAILYALYLVVLEIPGSSAEEGEKL